jgi:hypothetical protein
MLEKQQTSKSSSKRSITNKTNKEQQTQPDLHKTKKKPEKQISGSEPFDLEIWPSL